MRFLRLAVGIYALVQAILTRDYLLGMAGGFLLFMAVMNVGCCGVGGCSVNTRTYSGTKPQEIEYEEVDGK